MSRHESVDFDQPPTIAQLIEALEDLRASCGPDAVPRVTGQLEFHMRGPRVASVSAERPG